MPGRPSKKELAERPPPKPPLHDRLVALSDKALTRNLVLHADGWGEGFVLIERGTRDRQAHPVARGTIDELERWMASNA
jgi:hypothetical protein